MIEISHNLRAYARLAKFPKHYASLFEHLEEVRVSIRNPFQDHQYWMEEVA